MSGMPKAFLDHIVANMEADEPRLIYADWLEENHQVERAEFIRVQVERARLPAWDAAQVRLRIRERQLLAKHGEAWLAEFPAVEGARWEGFRRGIVAEVSFASFEAMRRNAHACRALAPVEAVTVRWPRQREELEGGDPIAELRELTLTGRPSSEEEIGWLADSPQLATLRVLTARGLWAGGLGRLVASPHLARLRAFRLPSNNLGNPGILALIGSVSLAALEELDLSGHGVSEQYNDNSLIAPPGLEALAGWAGLASVRSLNLSGNNLGWLGLRTLIRSPHVAAIKELSLRNTHVGEAMSEFREAMPGLRLEVLDIGNNVLKDVGAEYAATAACLRELKVLKLDRCEITLVGARLFAKKAAFLGELRHLEVASNHFRSSGLAALLERKPPVLHTLGLRDNDLLDEGAVLLAESPASDTLLDLDLSRNSLRSRGVEALGESPHLNGLVVLRLAENAIHGEDAAALAASPLGRRLAVLELEEATAPPPED